LENLIIGKLDESTTLEMFIYLLPSLKSFNRGAITDKAREYINRFPPNLTINTSDAELIQLRDTNASLNRTLTENNREVRFNNFSLHPTQREEFERSVRKDLEKLEAHLASERLRFEERSKEYQVRLKDSEKKLREADETITSLTNEIHELSSANDIARNAILRDTNKLVADHELVIVNIESEHKVVVENLGSLLEEFREANTVAKSQIKTLNQELLVEKQKVLELAQTISVCDKQSDIDSLRDQLAHAKSELESARTYSDMQNEKHRLEMIQAKSEMYECQQREKKIASELCAIKSEYQSAITDLEKSVSHRSQKHTRELQKMASAYEKEREKNSNLTTEFQRLLMRLESLESESAEKSRKKNLEFEEKNFQQCMHYETLVREEKSRVIEMEQRVRITQERAESIEKEKHELESKILDQKIIIKLKDEIITDLSDQLKSARAQLSDAEESARQSNLRDEQSRLTAEIEYLKSKIREQENLISEKDDTIKFVSSEVADIKSSYESRISVLRHDMESERESVITGFKGKIQDAASTLLLLDKELSDEKKRNEKLQLENLKLSELNACKILKIKSILGDTYMSTGQCIGTVH